MLAWNDLGMHCINAGYDTLVLLPPYNTAWAQVIRRGNPPQVVTSGMTCGIPPRRQHSSYGKRTYGQFWDYSQTLFGVTLRGTTGLNLTDPSVSNGLSGGMLTKGPHFQADGIPAVPVNDAGAWSPYQVAEITVRTRPAAFAQTRATVPSSDEINCAKCHGPGVRPYLELREHDQARTLATAPTPCSAPAATPTPRSGADPAGRVSSRRRSTAPTPRPRAACYDCHPGQRRPATAASRTPPPRAPAPPATAT